MKHVARFAFAVVATLAGLVILWRVREAVVLFVISLAVGAALRPLVRILSRSRLGRTGGLLLAYLAIVVVLLGGIVLAGAPLGRDAQRLADIAAIRYERAVTTWPQSPNGFLRQLGSILPDPDALYESLTGESGGTAAQALLGAAMGAFDILGQLGVVLILSVYWSVDRERLERLIFSLLPSRHRVDVRDTWHALEDSVGAYLRILVLQTLGIAALLWAGYALLGLEYAALTGVVSAVLGLVPWLGAPLGVLAAGLLAVGGPPIWALVVAGVFTVAVHVVVRFLLRSQNPEGPRLSSLLAVFLLVVMTLAIGLPGLLVAPPLAVGLQILAARFLIRRPADEGTDLGERLAALQERLEDVRERVSAGAAASIPTTLSLLERLEALLQEASTLAPVAAVSPRPRPTTRSRTNRPQGEVR